MAASAETVLVAKNVGDDHIGSVQPRRMRATVCVASTESPPKAKKSSSTPTASTPSTSPMIAARADSSGVDGRRRSGAAASLTAAASWPATTVSVDLAGESERYVLHQRQVLRDHVRGNTFGHRFADEFDGQLWVIYPESCGQNIGTARRRHQGCDRYRHARDLTQRNLDFADFDPIAADFDSVIAASHELQDSVRPVSGQIDGAVPGPAVVLDKPLGGEIRTSAVAPGEAASGDPQFAGDPVGAIGAPIVDHPAGIVGKRRAEWQRRQLRWECVDVADLENCVVDGGFR